MSDQAGWIPVESKTPKDNEIVLVYLDKGQHRVWLGFHDESGWFNVDGDDPPDRVTHWMPLPEPPS